MVETEEEDTLSCGVCGGQMTAEEDGMTYIRWHCWECGNDYEEATG